MGRHVMGRRATALAAVAGVVGLVGIACRGSDRPGPDPLAGALTRLDPGTYYYAVFQGPTQIGMASSRLTVANGHGLEIDSVRGRLVIAGDSQTVEARAVASLAPGFRVDSFAFSIGGDQIPVRMRGYPPAGARVLLPQLAPMALMLSGPATPGRSESYWVYNLLARDVDQTTIQLTGDTLFYVADRAAYDPARHTWVPAHSDTVRAWRATTPTGSVTAWVDRDGRIVAASEPGGLRLERTAREIAANNWGAGAQP